MLGGQLVAATLNTVIGTVPLDYVLKPSCVPSSIAGMSVGDLIAASNEAVDDSTLPPGTSFSDLNEGLTVVNENYDDCGDEGCILPPDLAAPPEDVRISIGNRRRGSGIIRSPIRRAVPRAVR